jgi:octaprenyl-diphosphate synthase
MKPVEYIKQPILEEMELFESKFRASMATSVPLLNRITQYIVRRKGKQMRPMLVFLTAKMLGEINQSTFTAAAMIELLHTASLVHDDVVDESYERRVFFSINALWKSKIAVLVGDYILSKGLLLAVKTKEYELLEIMSQAVSDMSEGELYQLEKSRKLDITEEDYFNIIKKKTASLISSCTANGAKSIGADEATLEEMTLFGEHLGVAFQIRDDLFDYSSSKTIGKPTGNDIKEKKMTLPLIYTLNVVEEKVKKKIIKAIKKNNKDPKVVKEIIDLVHEKGGIDYSTTKMLEYKAKCIEILNKYPDSEAKQSMLDLVEYTISRIK